MSRGELELVAERILAALAGSVKRLRLVDHDGPGVDRIEAPLLTRVLEQEVGGHVLGITDADLVDESGPDFFDYVFGCKDNRNQVAVVSTRRLGSARPGRALARLLKVGLHEIGHNFGLGHHYDFDPVGDGYCPIHKGDFNRHGERSYVRSVIDARALTFCESCRRFLRLAHPA